MTPRLTPEQSDLLDLLGVAWKRVPWRGDRALVLLHERGTGQRVGVGEGDSEHDALTTALRGVALRQHGPEWISRRAATRRRKHEHVQDTINNPMTREAPWHSSSTATPPRC